MAILEPPEERTCERCGRREVWSDDSGTWVARSEDDRGRPHCVHVWDVTGTYNPIDR